MIGTFNPQAEPYTHEIPEETTPSGIFARGSYSARSKASSSKFQYLRTTPSFKYALDKILIIFLSIHLNLYKHDYG